MTHRIRVSIDVTMPGGSVGYYDLPDEWDTLRAAEKQAVLDNFASEELGRYVGSAASVVDDNDRPIGLPDDPPPLYTDWLGQPIYAGDTVVYPSMSSRSCQITIGTLLDVYEVFYRDSKWVRLEPGQDRPTHTPFGGPNKGIPQPVDTEWRARIQPTGDSRDFIRYSADSTRDPETGIKTWSKLPAPVTLSIIKNITKYST